MVEHHADRQSTTGRLGDAFGDLLVRSLMEKRREDPKGFAPLYEELKAQPDIPVAQIEPGDQVITRGTQDYANGKAIG